MASLHKSGRFSAEGYRRFLHLRELDRQNERNHFDRVSLIVTRTGAILFLMILILIALGRG